MIKTTPNACCLSQIEFADFQYFYHAILTYMLVGALILFFFSYLQVVILLNIRKLTKIVSEQLTMLMELKIDKSWIIF